MTNTNTGKIRKGTILRAVRNSDDLGLDAGQRCTVVRVRGNRMDIESRDVTIASVEINHCDLEIV